MKILQVAPFFPPYIGGQERYVKNLAKGLVRSGNEVEVLTSNFNKAKEFEEIDGIRVRRFGVLCKILNNPISFMPLCHLIKHSGSFDVIHCHNEHALTSQYSGLASHYSHAPLVLTCHGQLRFDNFAKDLFERSYSKTFGRNLLRKASKVITISDSEREYVRSLGVPLEKVKVIPNGVDLGEIEYQKSGYSDIEAACGKRQVIVFGGPLLKRKGPHILIAAIPRIVMKCPNAFFVFVGGGHFMEEALRLVQELHVSEYTLFTGFIPRARMYEFYRRCDVFVLPSFSEALSYTILDAFVFSKPVVSTTIPCIKDHLKDVALLVPPGDAEALADAVIRLLDDRELAKELGLRGRDLVETRYRWDFVVEEHLKIYDNVLGN